MTRPRAGHGRFQGAAAASDHPAESGLAVG